MFQVQSSFSAKVFHVLEVRLKNTSLIVLHLQILNHLDMSELLLNLIGRKELICSTTVVSFVTLKNKITSKYSCQLQIEGVSVILVSFVF